MTDHDPLLAALAALDPTAADAPPPPGSARDRRILETAMTTDLDEATDPSPSATVAAPAIAHSDRRRRPRRSIVLAVGAVAATLLAVVAIVAADGPDGRPDPVAALTTAAEATGDVGSLRVHGTYERTDETYELDADVDGRDVHLRSSNGEWTIRIGDQEWSDEQPDPITVPDELRNEPFPVASRAVLDAALKGAVVTDLGDEEVDGVDAAHYRIELGEPGVEALRGLAPNLTAMFELEYPEAVRSMEVWVADDLIRRIELTFDPELTGTRAITLDFRDLGADIVVRPPA